MGLSWIGHALDVSGIGRTLVLSCIDYTLDVSVIVHALVVSGTGLALHGITLRVLSSVRVA
jgi:hypothetical protein